MSRLRTSVKFPVSELQSNSQSTRRATGRNRTTSGIRAAEHAPQLAMRLRHIPHRAHKPYQPPLRPRRRAAPHLPPPPPRRYEHTPNPLPHTAQHRTSRDAEKTRGLRRRSRLLQLRHSRPPVLRLADCPYRQRRWIWRQRESRRQQQRRLGLLQLRRVRSHLATAPSPLRAQGGTSFPYLLQLW